MLSIYMYNFMNIFFKTILLLIFLIKPLYTSNIEEDFNSWVVSYKKYAVKRGISKTTVENVFAKVKYLENVIIYDRKQPEFFEDTRTYVGKRATKKKVKIALNNYTNNQSLFDEIEKKFLVEKEILLSLWGIETNFGKYVGKMDIISSLATLSFDPRRSDFFSGELLILLKLIDEGIINHNTLFGSWAGAYGNFQFMPSTISSYAIDYDENGKIELKKSIKDATASAAHYINRIGWKYNQPCFYEIKTTKKIERSLINFSAKKIKNKMTVKKWTENGVVKINGEKIKIKNLKGAIIQPDGKPNTPMFIVFDNYEKILKWNRSLRFGISICTLANLIKNEI